jgi:hypothetical protein
MGCTKTEAKHYVYNAKHTVIPEVRISVRQLLQVTGTEYLRNCVHPDIHVMMWRRRVREALAGGHRVVCDDLRFPNEYAAVRSLGGDVWRVTRPDSPEVGHTHTSEGGLSDHAFHLHLINNSTVSELLEVVEDHVFAPY